MCGKLSRVVGRAFVVALLLGRTVYAGQFDSTIVKAPAPATQAQPPPAPELELPQASSWVLIEPPMKPNPYGGGAWSVDLLAPQGKWSPLDHLFASHEECEQYKTAELTNRARGTAGANFGSVNFEELEQMKAAALAHDTAKLAELQKRSQANLAESSARIQSITSIQNARCISK